MAFRLVVQLGEQLHRFPLASGELVVGSGEESGIRVRHPTVSRRHALVVVDPEGVAIEDLGSRNGTRVDGIEADGRVRLGPETALRLGSVQARLEAVEQGDLDVGIALAPDPGVAPAPVPSEAAPSTVGPAALEAFALRHLPALAEAVARGDGRTAVAQAVGAAIYRSLPCSWVVVARRDPRGEEPLLFEARRGSDAEVAPVAADTGGGYELRVAFLHPSLAQSFEPLVRAAAALVRLAAGERGTPPRRTAQGPTPPEPPSPPSIVPEVRRIYDHAARVARSRVSVLIRGESGTGKEILARFLHAASDRADSPLIALNCAALPRDLLEAELFGVERGVATGVEARAGKFEAADGGTLFLDEIGDMALETQARILRVLQEGEVYRLGSHSARSVDLRVVSATNRDLDELLAKGLFRADLYHRIADWVVELPPLRERRADVPNLAAHFLSRAARERGIGAAGISRAALDALAAYDWPGNVRQLEKEMERAALFLDDGELLDTSRLQPAILDARATAPSESLQSVREQAEREHIRRIVEECRGELPRAAERLEIGLSTLYAKLKALGSG